MKVTAFSSLLVLGGAASQVGATPVTAGMRPSNRMSAHDVPTVNYAPLKAVAAADPEHAHITRLRRAAAASRRGDSRTTTMRDATAGSSAAARRGAGSEQAAMVEHVIEKRRQQVADAAPDPGMMMNHRDMYYIMDIEVGGQQIAVQVDTGSSDTWFVQSPLSCVDFFYFPQPEAKCGFGKGFEGTFSGGMIDGDLFTRVYVDGTFVAGSYGFEDVNVGGIAVSHQQLALVNYTFWFGEGLTSGLMGLAYPLMTGLDGAGEERAAYDPVFTSMWKRELIAAPLFSIALSRRDPPSDAAGGAVESYIAFGGIPPHVAFDDSTWARAPVLAMSEISSIQSPDPGMYILKADAYVWGKGHNDSLTTSAGPPPDHLSVNTSQFPVIIDVGASVTMLPTQLAIGIFNSFDPPAQYDRSMGLWFARCDADPATFGVMFGSQTFYLAAQDLLRQGETHPNDAAMCRVGIVDDNYGPWVLGVTFLTNVLAVFDIGNREVRFASRIAY